MLRTLAFLGATLALGISIPAQASEDSSVERMTGYARYFDGHFAYREEHENRFENGRIRSGLTRYYDSQGQLFAELRSDYENDLRLPATHLRDFRSGAEDGLRWVDGGVELFRRVSRDAPVDLRRVSQIEASVSGPGFHQHLREHMERLAQDERLHLNLLVTMNLKDFDIRVRKENLQDDRLLLRFESDNWLLRLIAPSVTAVYDVPSRRIVKFRGRSNIDDARGRSQDVVIDYSYSSESASR